MRQPQVHGPQLRAMKNRIRKVAAKKLHSARLRFRKIRARQNSFRHVRVSQVGPAKIHSRQVRTRQLSFAQIRTLKIRAAQTSSAQIDALQISLRKIGASQVLSRYALLPAKESLVRRKNVRQPLAIVLNAFSFSQSHSLLSTPWSDDRCSILLAPRYPDEL